jgi:Tfp pilus assembly protein PilV
MVGTRARHTVASHEGFALMEVIVSAAVLVVVVLGVLAGLDAVTSTAGANKARTVAATLAEKDQERLRGMRVPDIDKMNLLPYDVQVGKVKYHVESEASWVVDASGEEVGCTLSKDQASYMRITSTVTSPITGKKVKPVVISSIVAPQVGASSSGSLAVLVKGAAGQPIQGASVSAVGPKAVDAESTNELGCAVFGELTAGTYQVALSKTGYVDKEGNPGPSNDATVTVGTTSTIEFAYDAAAAVTLNVKDQPANTSEPAKSVVAANGELGGGLRTFGPNPTSIVSALDDTFGTPAVTYSSGTTFTLTNLFPFVNGYTFYSGGCTGNDPTKAIPAYFTTYPAGKVILAPGTVGTPIDVYEPSVAISVKRNGIGVSGVPVWAYPTNTPGCENMRIKLGNSRSDTNGTIQYDGLPYGNYTLCAYQSSTARRATATVNVNGTGVTAPTLALNSSTKVCGYQTPDGAPNP